MTATTFMPESVTGFGDAIADATEHKRHVIVCGGQSKTRIAATTPDLLISTEKYTGIVDHQASDFTITVRAGTPIRDVCQVLQDAGQYLPFDPTFPDRGATAGGVVAAGLNGPCRLRYGGIRDFLIGCQFIDGAGRAIRSGGKVVKNAAGFDISKFLIGSAGRFGLITEVTFKVFPQPRQYMSLRFPTTKLNDALSLVRQLHELLDFEAIEILECHTVAARISGDSELVLGSCVRQVQQSIEMSFEQITGAEEVATWQDLSNFRSISDSHMLVKVPLILPQIGDFDQQLSQLQIKRRYSAAGNVAFLRLKTSTDVDRVRELLSDGKLTGQLIVGPREPYLLGEVGAMPFLQRVKRAVDPGNVFGHIDQRSVEAA